MSRGFTLLEVIVALLVLELAVMGAVGTLVVAARTQRQAETLERGVAGAEGVLDSLAGAPGAGGGERIHSAGRLEWSVDDSGSVVVRATGPSGDTLFTVHAWLSPQ